MHFGVGPLCRQACQQRLALLVLHCGGSSGGMAMHNQLSDKPALARCLGRQKISSIAPVLMKIAKEPDDGYTSGSLRQEQPAYGYNTRCSESAMLGGARQKRFGVRAWHWQACQQCLALFCTALLRRSGRHRDWQLACIIALAVERRIGKELIMALRAFYIAGLHLGVNFIAPCMHFGVGPSCW